MSDTKLWMLHIQGPDDIVAAPSREAAERVAAAFNSHWSTYLAKQRAATTAAGTDPDNWPTITAVVVEWDSTPTAHARNMKKFWPDYAEYGRIPPTEDAIEDPLSKAAQAVAQLNKERTVTGEQMNMPLDVASRAAPAPHSGKAGKIYAYAHPTTEALLHAESKEMCDRRRREWIALVAQQVPHGEAVGVVAGDEIRADAKRLASKLRRTADDQGCAFSECEEASDLLEKIAAKPIITALEESQTALPSVRLIDVVDAPFVMVEVQENGALCRIDFRTAQRPVSNGRHSLYLHPAPSARLSDAARDVLAERERQIGSEGWTPQHDDEHVDGDLLRAAAAYIIQYFGVPVLAPNEIPSMGGIPLWPWDTSWWKPGDPRRDLIKAGALILAEVERIDRLDAAQSAGSTSC